MVSTRRDKRKMHSSFGPTGSVFNQAAVATDDENPKSGKQASSADLFLRSTFFFWIVWGSFSRQRI